MQDNDMREKLEKIISAYEELQAKMSDPAVLADQKAYNHLAKEYANQGPLTAKAREYLACCSDIDDAKEMLADPDMKEFAQETIAEAVAQLDAHDMSGKLEEQLRRKMRTVKAKNSYDLRTKLLRYGAGLGFDFSEVNDLVERLVQHTDSVSDDF